LTYLQGASLNFGSGSAAPVTFLPAVAGFATPGATPSATASAFQYNCPLNWLISGTQSVPVTPPQSTDSVTIPSDGRYVSTFAQNTAASMLMAGSVMFNANSQPNMCSGNQQGMPIAGNPGSSLDWGGGPCQNMFAWTQTVASSCGNLVVSQLTGVGDAMGPTTIYVYTCPDASANCGVNGNIGVVVHNATGTATTGTIVQGVVTQTAAGTMVAFPATVSSGSVTVNPGVMPSVSDPDGASDSSSSSSLLLIIIIIAVVVVVAVAGVLYVKKSKSQPAPASAGRGGGFGGVGFENPLYDENPGKAQGGGPQYADAPSAAQQESGYMDVPAEGDGGGYLDVDAEDADEDNF